MADFLVSHHSIVQGLQRASVSVEMGRRAVMTERLHCALSVLDVMRVQRNRVSVLDDPAMGPSMAGNSISRIFPIWVQLRVSQRQGLR